MGSDRPVAPLTPLLPSWAAVAGSSFMVMVLDDNSRKVFPSRISTVIKLSRDELGSMQGRAALIELDHDRYILQPPITPICSSTPGFALRDRHCMPRIWNIGGYSANHDHEAVFLLDGSQNARHSKSKPPRFEIRLSVLILDDLSCPAGKNATTLQESATFCNLIDPCEHKCRALRATHVSVRP